MISDLSWMPFKNISLDDPFFESLKDDYPGFDVWFKKKSLNGDKALVLLEEERIEYHQKGNNNVQLATLCSCSRMTVWKYQKLKKEKEEWLKSLHLDENRIIDIIHKY